MAYKFNIKALEPELAGKLKKFVFEYEKEYRFAPTFRGIKLPHILIVDFFCKDKIFLECKAIDQLGVHERLQLWNYMRAAGIRIGILYNFAPLIDECEKYYYDPETRTISYF